MHYSLSQSVAVGRDIRQCSTSAAPFQIICLRGSESRSPYSSLETVLPHDPRLSGFSTASFLRSDTLAAAVLTLNRVPNVSLPAFEHPVTLSIGDV